MRRRFFHAEARRRGELLIGHGLIYAIGRLIIFRKWHNTYMWMAQR